MKVCENCGIEYWAQQLHDAINRPPRSWGEVLGEPDLAGPDLADDIAVTVDAIEDGHGADAYRAFVSRWLPEEREAA